MVSQFINLFSIHDKKKNNGATKRLKAALLRKYSSLKELNRISIKKLKFKKSYINRNFYHNNFV
jgi:hypothetical protein